MVTNKTKDILLSANKWGWVMEPDAIQILKIAGLDTPRLFFATSIEEALKNARLIGYPVVAKIVSPEVVHKSDVHGVVTGIFDDVKLHETFNLFSKINGFQGILIEETLSGIELIIGAKIDNQFGAMVLLGMGGTEVEIYRDTTLRMAPLKQNDALSMIRSLKAHRLLEGYRGYDPISIDKLSAALVTFSRLALKLEAHIESIDCNPVMCTSQRCVVADARFILKSTMT